MKIEQRLMKMSEAKDVIEKAADRVKSGEDRLKESLAKNIETVKLYKGQEGVTSETKIPMLIEVEETPAEANATILKELSEIKKSVGELKPSIEALKKETTATNTLALVNETIDGLVAGLDAIKAKANSGTGITPDELSAAWPGYETREFISGLMATLNNMQKAVDAYKPLEKYLADALKKDGDGDGGDGEGDDSGTPEGGEPGEGGDGKGDKKPDDGDDKPGDGKEGDEGGDGGNPDDSGDGGDGGDDGDEPEDDAMSNMDLSPPLESNDDAAESDNVIIEG